ncbi:MAG: M14 family metallopeptidase [Verrucomicrobiota bacterium]|nr:M14 family metallopeptidase [Verrucomicrobiota bacterium]
MNGNHPPHLPILGALEAGTTQRHLVKLPGAALADEPRPVTTITGAQPGPVVFVGAGVHGGEYPPIEAVIRLAALLSPAELSGTLILMPVLNLPAFWSRTSFICPVDGVNPNRVFPGAVDGSYSEQMTHALMNEFVAYADAYLDLHGGDIPEALVPFSICRGGTEPVDAKSRELATVFGLPFLLAVNRPIQPAKGSSSYVAAAESGIPAVLAEAGGVGQLQPEAVRLLTDGVLRVLAHLGMIAARVPPAPAPAVLHGFEWVYAERAGMFYPNVAAGDIVQTGQEIGTIGSLFGETLERVIAPATGRVLFLTINPAVRAQGLLMGIGTE